MCCGHVLCSIDPYLRSAEYLLMQIISECIRQRGCVNPTEKQIVMQARTIETLRNDNGFVFRDIVSFSEDMQLARWLGRIRKRVERSMAGMRDVNGNHRSQAIAL